MQIVVGQLHGFVEDLPAAAECLVLGPVLQVNRLLLSVSGGDWAELKEKLSESSPTGRVDSSCEVGERGRRGYGKTTQEGSR